MSKATVTNPEGGPSRGKPRVIPSEVGGWHHPPTKGATSASGRAVVVSGSWRGHGPPSLRRLPGVRAWPGTLGLRHCPDTYGWLQSRIFGNGRQPDRATPRGGRRPSGCKLLSRGSKGRWRAGLERSLEEARAKFVPAAAVRRTVRTLFGFTGLKARVGGFVRPTLKSPGSTGEVARIRRAWRGVGGAGTSGGAVKCVEIGRNARGESELLDAN